jgi:succinate dehydrogenase/fumarate reductase-like Fe-S protein
MTADVIDNSICLRVHRGTSQSDSRLIDYTLPAGAAASLLDGLRWIRSHVDHTLAFRYACINANACKECMVRVDGKTVYACLVSLKPGRTYLVEPLPNKALIRDLVTEIAPGKERLLEGDDQDD